MDAENLFITTVAMPHEVRAGLDTLKAKRAAKSGRRPTTRELIVEALEVFLRRQSVMTAST